MSVCLVCDSELWFRWTDTHGIAVCGTCGLPYRIYHYENDQRVEKPPACTIAPAWIPLAREYWAERKRRVFPGAHDIGILRRRGSRTYSGATEEDIDTFEQWINAHKHRWPPVPEADAATEQTI